MSFKFEIKPTGCLYTKYESEEMKIKNLQIEIEWVSGELRIIDPPSLVKLKPSEGWLKSIEPEDHLDLVAEQITTVNRIEGRKILCFSYKDISLANRLTPELADVVFDEINSIASSMFEDYEESKLKDLEIKESGYDIILIRHYLEHHSNPGQLIRCLTKYLKDDGVLYIEVPDVSIYLENANPIMFWEQHRHFFTEESLSYLCENAGLDIIDNYVTECSTEPSICFCTKKLMGCQERDEKMRVAYRKLKLNACDFSRYIQRWRERIERCDGAVGVFGVGHNVDRFLQLTQTTKKIDVFYDGSPNKYGKYLAGANTGVIDKINKLRKCESIILGIHPRQHQLAEQKLRDKGVSGQLLNIFGK